MSCKILIHSFALTALIGAVGCGGNGSSATGGDLDAGPMDDAGHMDDVVDDTDDVMDDTDDVMDDTDDVMDDTDEMPADGGTDMPADDSGAPVSDMPMFSISDADVAEGDTGTSDLTFTITLSEASETAVSVAYTTQDGSAKSGGTAAQGDQDYAMASGTAMFEAGVTQQTVTVSVNGDALNEADEQLSVVLSNPVAATIDDGEGVGTISNDDDAPTVSVANAEVAELDTGTAVGNVVLTLSAPSGRAVSVDWSTLDETAVAGEDYLAAQGSVTFEPGQTEKTVQVTVSGDTLDEDDETFVVELSNATHTEVADAEAVVTITDNDDPPTASISSANISEGDSGTAEAVLTVSLSVASGRTTSVDYASADGTATAGDDYAAISGTLTFAPGETMQTVSVVVNGDTDQELDETLSVTLANPQNMSVSVGEGTLTILNDDGSLPGIAVNDVAVDEGAGSTTLSFTVTLTEASTDTVTVAYATGDDSATAGGTAASGGEDYDAASGTLSFAPGETSKSVDIAVNGDALHESDETFSLTLSGATNAAIVVAEGTGTITNDDAAPALSIGDVAISEGASGTRNATFAVNLSAAAGQNVVVDYATSDETATAGTDYVAASGTLTLEPGTTSALLSVSINGDLLNEDDETFVVDLSNAQNATIDDAQATGTITNDDDAPEISIGDVSIQEGDIGTQLAVFTASLSAVSGRAISVDWDTADDTATAGEDYVAGSGTLEFPAGETTRTISVTVNGDEADEPNETFVIDLSNPQNASIGDAQGVGTVINDDAALPTLSINDASLAEGDSGTDTLSLTVTLSTESTGPVSVSYATSHGSATDEDYESATGILSFAAGETSKTVDVVINGDTTHEGDDTFLVDLSNALGAFIADGQATGTIVNDDGPPEISIDDVSMAEGNSGVSSAEFTVTLSAESELEVSVAYATADGTATESGSSAVGNNDYESQSAVLTFAPGVTTQTITVSVNGDTLKEEDETFLVQLDTAQNGNISDGEGQGTIIDDDDVPTLSINDVSAIEGDAGLKTFTFLVQLSSASGDAVTVDYATADDVATSPTDYLPTFGSLTFAPGETLQIIQVMIKGDLTPEGDEPFSLSLSDAVGATLAKAQGIGTITNDD